MDGHDENCSILECSFLFYAIRNTKIFEYKIIFEYCTRKILTPKKYLDSIRVFFINLWKETLNYPSPKVLWSIRSDVYL